jgi:hypothetical protein
MPAFEATVYYWSGVRGQGLVVWLKLDIIYYCRAQAQTLPPQGACKRSRQYHCLGYGVLGGEGAKRARVQYRVGGYGQASVEGEVAS